MESYLSFNEAIAKAIEIKASGEVKAIRVGLSNSPDDPIVRINLKIKEIIEKLNK